MSDSGIHHLQNMIGDQTLEETANIMEQILKENKQFREQTDIERNFYPLYVTLYDAWLHAKTNEECARILRLFVTDLVAFKQEFPHGEKKHRKGNQADKLRKKAIKEAAERAATAGGTTYTKKEEV
jgi:hypothetical protein